MNARLLLGSLFVPVLLTAGCMKPFQRENSQTPTHEDAATKPETLVSLGDVRAEAALLPTQKSSDRDRLQGLALQAYQSALSRDPNNLNAQLGMARVFCSMQDRDRMMACYQNALKVQPKNAAIWYEIGCGQGRLKDWNGAVDSLHQACQLEPDNRMYRKMLGMTLARSGRFEEGYAWLIRSMNEAEAHYALGRMMEHMKQETASREQMTLALKADPNFKPAREFFEDMISNIEQPPVGGAVMQAGYTSSGPN